MDAVQYDKTGKISLTNIYNRLEPTSYFATLSQLDYGIPQAAKPAFERLIEARRQISGEDQIKIVDIGCSYGVNAALLKHGLSMDDLYAHYGDGPGRNRAGLLARDRALFDDPADDQIEIVGVDQAANAIGYAVDAGALDAGMATDLEVRDPLPAERELIAGADLIISTGCYGYVTQKSLERLLKAAGGRPWMAHFVLRMFPFDAAAAMLDRHGYATEKAPGLFRQRRFASMEERGRVIANLNDLGIDPKGAEATGWYFAELHVSRPRQEAEKTPLDELLKGAGEPFLPN